MINSSLSIMLNLYECGFIKEDENNVAVIKSTNNDYEIQFKRININSQFNNYFNYFCNFKFLDNQLKIVLFEMNLSEIEVSILVDSLYQYLEFNMKDITIPFRQFRIVLDQVELNNYNMYIYENNLKRLSIKFDDTDLLDYINIMYFVFLIDLNS